MGLEVAQKRPFNCRFFGQLLARRQAGTRCGRQAELFGPAAAVRSETASRL